MRLLGLITFEVGMDVSKLFIKLIEQKVLILYQIARKLIRNGNLITLLFESFDKACGAVFELFNELDASVASSAKLFFSSDC